MLKARHLSEQESLRTRFYRESGAHSDAELVEVAVVESDPASRQAIVELLAATTGHVCVGAFESGEAVLDTRVHAQVILLDASLRNMQECAVRLHRLYRGLKILLMVCVPPDFELVRRTVRAGVSGFVMKPLRASDLLSTIRFVMADGFPLSRVAVENLVLKGPSKLADSPNWSLLTNRQSEIAELLDQGLMYKEIADLKKLKMGTVTQHVHNIYERLRVHRRFEAMNKLHEQENG
jgi:two-component system, NarL family, response regulator LiaR